MHEIAELADECTVFRNGRKIATYTAGTKTDTEVVELMIGREYQQRLSAEAGGRRTERRAGPRMPEARAGRDRLADICFAVRPGEVIGLGGLDGQGQRELLLALFGVLRGCTGEVLVDGRPVNHRRARPRRSSGRIGMALIPEDRKTEGLMLPMTVRENLSFAALDRVSQQRHHRPRGGRQADRRDGRSCSPSARPGWTSRSARCRAATSRRWSSPNG